MAKPTNTTKTTTITTDPQPQREHFTDEPALARRIRSQMIGGALCLAIDTARTAGFRIDESDLFRPFSLALSTLTDEDERREYSKRFAVEIREETKALERLRYLVSTGHNDGSRAAEIAAKRAAAEQAARDQAVRIETTTAQILARQEADRIAAAHAMATAMVRK